MSNAQSVRISTADLAAKKRSGERFAMLTCYEQITAEIFDGANIPVLLVGDSAGNNFLGFENTIPVTVDELIPMARAVVNSSSKAMVVADLPFGSYEASPEQALSTGIRFFKEAKVGAVKLEGGAKVVPQIEKLIAAGIPVMGHLGLTPQSVHTLGGFKEITTAISIPTIGIGAGVDCDGQVLVWTDLMGLTAKMPKLAKAYRNMRKEMSDAVSEFAEDVAAGRFPTAEQSFN